MAERKEFEMFLSRNGFTLNYYGDGQYAGGNRLAYEAWQACAELKDKRIEELEDSLLATREHLFAATLGKVNTQAFDCNKCANRGATNGLSEESYCSQCAHGYPWLKDHFKPLPAHP